jgi:peroxiredoxin
MKVKTILLSASALFLMSCATDKNEGTNIAERPLESDLNNRKENFSKTADKEKLKIYAEGLEAVVASNTTGKALQVGDVALDFKLPNAAGKEVTLYSELEKGPVILMWYRGGWCPYCNMALHHMQQALPEFKKYNAHLLAVSPEVPDSSISSKEKHELEFEVLSDLDNKVAKQYKVVYKLTDEVASIYEKGFGLSDYNGNDTGELPLAVTYIIGQDKVIKYAFLDADYRNRAEPQDLIDFLKKM